MVEYIKIGNTEYVKKKLGEVTTDDPVGNYLFERFNKKSKGKVELCGRKMSYTEALEYFESGQMIRSEYEGLLSKRKKATKSLTQMREEMQASQILKRRGLLKNLFGSDLSELTEIEKDRLRVFASSIGNFRSFVKPYFERRISEDYPKDYFKDSDYPEKILGFAEGTVGLESLEKILETLRYVLDQHIDWNSKGRLRYPGNEHLKEEFYQLRSTGSVFSLARFLKYLPRRLR